MFKSFTLREITNSDWKVLLDWRNDKITRYNSFNSELISIKKHKKYIKNIILTPSISQFILEYNDIPVGTIREDSLENNDYELSYTVCPKHRGKRIGQTMMYLFLTERNENFLCRVNQKNIPSIKMIEKIGFKLFKTEKNLNFYKFIPKKILFLGNHASPLLKWLRSSEGFVMQTSEKITTEFVHLNNINFIVSYGYRHILGKDILDLFPDRGINLHISYLPFNRGGDPNFWSFLENTPKGVTIHYLDEGVDTGDIIAQEKVEFDISHETLSTTYTKLSLTIENLFKENWQDIKAIRCNRQKQVGKGTSHKVKDKVNLNKTFEFRWDTPIMELEAFRVDNFDKKK